MPARSPTNSPLSVRVWSTTVVLHTPPQACSPVVGSRLAYSAATKASTVKSYPKLKLVAGKVDVMADAPGIGRCEALSVKVSPAATLERSERSEASVR